jgi:hypothetical protein
MNKRQININSLKGSDRIARSLELMSSINESTTSTSKVELIKKGPDGVTYAIIRENRKYYIKNTNQEDSKLTVESFNYIGGLANKKTKEFKTYALALKNLNLKFLSLNESLGLDNVYDMTKADIILENTTNDINKKYKLTEGITEIQSISLGDDMEFTEGVEAEDNADKRFRELLGLEPREETPMVDMEEETPPMPSDLELGKDLPADDGDGVIDSIKPVNGLDLSDEEDDELSFGNEPMSLTELFDLDEDKKFTMKLKDDSKPKEMDMGDEPEMDMGDDESEEMDMDISDDSNDEATDDKPFDDEPFDAEVEADEDEDPEKYIQQLAGKLGQTLRDYTKDLDSPDFDLEKFVINSIISATNSSEMEEDDQEDIIDKLKDSDTDTSGDDDSDKNDSEDEELSDEESDIIGDLEDEINSEE